MKFWNNYHNSINSHYQNLYNYDNYSGFAFHCSQRLPSLQVFQLISNCLWPPHISVVPRTADGARISLVYHRECPIGKPWENGVKMGKS